MLKYAVAALALVLFASPVLAAEHPGAAPEAHKGSHKGEHHKKHHKKEHKGEKHEGEAAPAEGTAPAAPPAQ